MRIRPDLPPSFTALVFMLFCAALFQSRAWAQASVTDGVVMSASDMFRDMEKKTVKLDGNVQLLFKGNHLSCDHALLDMEKQQVTAEGHVILNNETAHVEGDKIIFNYKTNTGFIYNGFVQSGQVVFEGEIVEKVGEKRYIATNAAYTACETCPPGWSFSGKVIDAEIGGYARIQRPVFRIAGVPVLILPSLIVPLKSSRQSGFLVPGMGFSQSGGMALSAIYFWAIDRSQDVTLTARWYKLRGYKALGDYRYLLSKDSHGRLQSAWMTDRQLPNQYPLLPTSVDRWFVNYSHYYDLPDGFVQRMDIKQTSDLRYTRDFPDEITGWGDPSLENKASMTKSTDDQYVSAEVDVYENLLKYYPVQRNDDAVNRFPEIRYSAKEQRLFGDDGPLVRMDVDYVNFAGQTYNYDNLQTCTPGPPYPNPCTPLGYQAVVGPAPKLLMQRTGYFERGLDLWRTGQRLDVQPTVSYPFQIARRFDILPSVTYREMQYRFSSQAAAADDVNGTAVVDTSGDPIFASTAARRYVQADILAKTEFSRVFGDFSNPGGSRWKHAIEPEIGYSQIPWMRQPNHPFIGSFSALKPSRQFEPLSDTNLGDPRTGVQFDYNDRVYERRLGTYAISNRITRKVWNDGVPDYKTVVLFQVGQSFDFKEASRTDAHPWSTIDSMLVTHFDHFETLTTNSYDTYADVANTTSLVKLMVTGKNYLQFAFNQTYLLNDNDTVVPNTQTRNYGLGTGMVTKYFDVVGQIDYSDITHQLMDWSYIMNIRPPGRCWVIHLEQLVVLGGDLQTNASLSFDFGGETKSEAATRSQAL